MLNGHTVTTIQMKRFANILMLLSFALLQCTAPLAHAHIDGGDAGNAVHMPEAELADAHGSSKIDHSGSGIETQDPGVQGDDRLREYIVAHAIATGFTLHAAEPTETRHYRSPVHPLTYPSTRSHRPYPQAPPARGPK